MFSFEVCQQPGVELKLRLGMLSLLTVNAIILQLAENAAYAFHISKTRKNIIEAQWNIDHDSFEVRNMYSTCEGTKSAGISAYN